MRGRVHTLSVGVEGYVVIDCVDNGHQESLGDSRMADVYRGMEGKEWGGGGGGEMI